MKRIFTGVLVLLITFALASCVGIHYQETEYDINGYTVYRYDHRTSERECDRISVFGLFVRDGDIDYVTNVDFGECISTLFVKDGGTYLNLTEAVELEVISLQDVLDVNWDFDVFATMPLLSHTTFDNMVFRTATTTTTLEDIYGIDVEEEIDRILQFSESLYQRFIVDYFPETVNGIGFIDVYNDDVLVLTLEVYDEGIYDPVAEAFQEVYSSELHGLFLAAETLSERITN